jgi:hypothetical protein
MALYEVDAPDGVTYRVEAPDGTPPELVSRKFQRDLYPDILREKNKPLPPEEKQSSLRQVADVPLQVGKGAVSGVRMISDAFGAGSDTSNTIRGVEDYLGSLLSAKSQKNAQEISRIMNDAKDKGVWDQVVAAVRAIGTAPVDLVSNALGTSAPAIIAGLLAPEAAIGAAVAAGVGAVIGAGSIKGSIYEEVKQELAGKLPPEEVEKRAQLAQQYNGENLDQILLGAGFGTLDAVTGANRILTNVARKTAGKTAILGGEKEAGKSLLKRTALGAAEEAPLEALQGGQEQLAQNLAIQREGIDRPTWQGVAGQMALEGGAGALAGSVTAGAFGKRPAPVIPPAGTSTAPPPPNAAAGAVVPPAPPPVPGLPSAGGPLATSGSVAQVLSQPPGAAATPAGAQQLAQATAAQQLAAKIGATGSAPQPGPTQLVVPPPVDLLATSGTPIAPAPAQIAPVTPAPAPFPSATLPSALSNAMNFFGTKGGNVLLTFENDIDKALYIVRDQKKKSKSHDKYMDWLASQGLTETDIKREAGRTNNYIKGLLAMAPGVDTYHVPPVPRMLGVMFKGQAPAVQQPAPAAQAQQQPPEIQQLIQALQAQQQPPVSAAPVVEPPTTALGQTAAPVVEPPVDLGPEPVFAPPMLVKPPVPVTPTPPEHLTKTVNTSVKSVRKLQTEPMLVELSDVISSEVPGYQKELQPRDRSKLESENQINGIVAEFDPSRLMFDPSADRGAPIVNENGHVESGNGRIMALRKIYESRPELVIDYKNELMSNGFDIEGMKNPVLVQRRVTPLTPRQIVDFVETQNKPGVLEPGPTEISKRDALRINASMLNKIPENGDWTNPNFIREFMKNVSDNEMGGLSENGKITEKGYKRIRNAIFYLAYGDAQSLARISVTPEDNVKSISTALIKNAANFAKIRASINEGRTDPGFSSEPLIDAVNRISDMRDRKFGFEDYIKQQDVFNPISPMTEKFMRLFYSDKTRSIGDKSRALGLERISQGLNYYSTEALKISPEPALGFGLPPVTPMDLITAATNISHRTVQPSETQTTEPVVETLPLVTENIQPPTVETAPPLAAVTVTEKKRVNLGLTEGTVTRVTFSDGTVTDIQRMNSAGTMGLPGWHDTSKSVTQFSYLGDTEAQAIQELLQRRNAEKFAPMTTTPLDNTVLDSVKKTTHLNVNDATRAYLDEKLPGVLDVLKEAQYRLYPGTTMEITGIQNKTMGLYGRAKTTPNNAQIQFSIEDLMKDYGGKNYPQKLMHTLLHEFAHPIQKFLIHTSSVDTQVEIAKQFQKDRSSTAAQRAFLYKYLVESQNPGIDMTSLKSKLLAAFNLTEQQYQKIINTTKDIGEKNDLYRFGLNRKYLRSFEEWVAERGARWLSKELEGRIPQTVFEKFQKAVLDKLRDAYEVVAKIMGIRTDNGAFEKLLSDIWGVRTTTSYRETGKVDFKTGKPVSSFPDLPSDQKFAYEAAVNGNPDPINNLPGGPTAKLNSERWSKVVSATREFFDPWFTVDKFPILSEFRNLLFGKIGMATQRAKDLSSIISKGTQEVQTQTYTYLTTRNADPTLITDEKVRAAAEEVKKEINRTALELVQKGYISEDSLAKYYDQYLPRMYLYYEMTGRGIKTSNMGVSPREYLDLRKELPEETRQIMGEIKNPAFLSYIALSRPQADLAKMDYFNNIVRQTDVRWIAPNSLVDFEGHKVTPYWLANEAKVMRELGKLTEQTDPAGSQEMFDRATNLQLAADQVLGTLSDQIPDGYKRMPDSASYGALRGAIVQKGIYDDIIGTFVAIPISEKPFMQSLLGDERSSLVKANQIWKMMKVTLNVPSQIRNMVSNAIALNVFGGVPLHRIAPLLLRASKEVSENGNYWQEAQKYGITGGTMSSAELIQMRATLEQYLRKGGGKDMMGAFAAMRIAAGNAVGAASDIYQKTEVLFKMVQFIYEREKGSTASQAVDAANDALFDYTKVNPNIRFLRNSPIGLPFVTYYYKVLPKLVETAYKHPLRFAPYVALAASIPYLTMAALDIDSDDYEALRKSLPEYIRNKGSLFILPWKDEKGRWEYMDVSSFFPWAAFTDPIIQATLRQDPKGAASEAIKLITPSGPIVTTLAAITTGKDPFTDKDIIDPRQTPENKALALMSYVWSQTLPSMLAIDLVNPQNASGAIPRLYNDVFGDGTGLDKRGQPKPEFLADAARLFGANISPLEPVTQRALNINHMLAQVHASESLRAQIAKDQSMTPNRRMQEISSLNEKIRDDYKKLQEYAQETARATSLKK